MLALTTAVSFATRGESAGGAVAVSKATDRLAVSDALSSPATIKAHFGSVDARQSNRFAGATLVCKVEVASYPALMKPLSIRTIAKRFGVAHTTVMWWSRRGAPINDLVALEKWLAGARAKPKLTQRAVANHFKRSEPQVSAWKKSGAPVHDLHLMEEWFKARGLVREASHTQRWLAKAVGVSEHTLGDWKKLGAPMDSEEALRKWMLEKRRRSRNSGRRQTHHTPLYKVAAQAGISCGTLRRFKREGAPTRDADLLRKWLEKRESRKNPTRKVIAQQLQISVDTLRRWERQGAPVIDLEKCRLWMKKQRAVRQQQNERAKLRRRISRRVRERFRQFVNRGRLHKEQSVFALVGCTQEELLSRLEGLFKEGMSWDNLDQWQIDHIIPCAAFDLTLLAEQRKCFHYTNLRPCWTEENAIKGARLDWKLSK